MYTPNAFLWSCSGDVLLSETVDNPETKLGKECQEEMMLPLSNGTRIRVDKGRALLTDGLKLIKLGGPGEKRLHHVKHRYLAAKTQTDTNFKNILKFLLSSTRDAILKTDDAEIQKLYPYIDFVGMNGPLIPSWDGIIYWKGLPSNHAMALRVLKDERIVWGPEILAEPIFNLEELSHLGLEEARIELLLIDSPYLPNLETLSLPVARLSSIRGNPIPSILHTEFRLASTEEQDRLLLPFDEISGEAPPLIASALAIQESRPQRAREILWKEYGNELPLAWQRSISGLELRGSFEISGRMTGLPCAKAGDSDALWNCFWKYLGPAVVPEIPPDDLPSAALLVKRLQEMDPNGWRPIVARAQIDFLLTRHKEARQSLVRARSLCANDIDCLNTTTILENIVVVDSHSSLSKGLSQTSLKHTEPGFLINSKERNMKLARAWDSVDPGAKQASAIWRMASNTRWRKGALDSLRYQLPQKDFIATAKEFQKGVQFDDDHEPAGDLLQWSLYPEEKPPILPNDLHAYASFLRAEYYLAPNGSFGAADLDPPLDAIVYRKEGLFSPSRVLLDTDGFERGLEILAFSSPPDNSILAARRLMLMANAQISRGNLLEAERALDYAEAILKSNKLTPTQDVVALNTLRATLAVSLDTGRANQFLRTGYIIAVESESYGNVESVLKTWEDLAKSLFYHHNRYLEGLNLLEDGRKAASESHFLSLAIQMIALEQTFLSDLELYPNIIRKAEENRKIVAELNKLLTNRNKEILEKIESEQLPDIARELTSLVEFNSMASQLMYAEAGAMANLGASWKDIRKTAQQWTDYWQGMQGGTISEKSKKELATILSPEQPYGVLAAIANSDFVQAEKLALTLKEEAGRPFFHGLFSFVKGDHSFLRDQRKEIDKYQGLLETIELGEMPGFGEKEESQGFRMLLRQKLLQDRELFIWLAAGEKIPKLAKEQMEAWTADELSGRIGKLKPWRKRHLEALTLEAEGETVAAFEAYEMLVSFFRRSYFASQDKNFHQKFVKSQEDAYLGSARTAWDLSHGSNSSLALDRVDELRWLSGNRSLSTLHGSLPALDLLKTAERLGPDGVLLIVADFGRYRESTVWLYHPNSGLEAATFTSGTDELLTKEAIRRSVDKNALTPNLKRMTEWIGERLPPDAPVALVVDGSLRKLGIHLLPIEGTSLALRNPLVLAPSLRSLANAQSRSNDGVGHAFVGLELTNRAEPGVYQPSLDHQRLSDLAKGGTFLWNEAATVEAVEDILVQKARIHLSTHGVVDSINPKNTGIRLYEKRMLNLERVSRLKVPGSLIVLSACQSGDWGEPSAGTVSTLDKIFLAQGASNVVSAADAVRHDVAALWMEQFYKSLDQGNKPIVAAQSAYQKTAKKFPSPWDWGGFALVGSGDGDFSLGP